MPVRAACLLLLLAAPVAAHPHEAPTIWVDAEIREGRAQWTLTLRLDHLAAWFPGVEAGKLMEPVAPVDRDAVLERAAAFFAERNPVTVDGAVVAPAPLALATPENGGQKLLEFAALTVAYPCDGWPDEVTFLWGAFEVADEIPATLVAGPRVDAFGFRPDRRAYTWTRPADLASRLAAIRPVAAAPAPPPSAATPYTVLLVTVFLSCILLQKRARRAALATVLAGGAAGTVLWLAGAGTPAAAPAPTPAQARLIFGRLHANLYAAFDAASESEIYRLLAVSVAPDLLPELYGDVYESLVLREQGGAVARVEGVDTTAGAIDFADPGRFVADWRWRVNCTLAHWGHTHRRVNEYHARYEVARAEGVWRIAGVTVLEHKRLDLEGDGEDVVAAD